MKKDWELRVPKTTSYKCSKFFTKLLTLASRLEIVPLHTEQHNKKMRTKTTLLTAALLAVGAISATAQSNVYSLNVVGYINVPIGQGY
ncbi:hypothetical protein Cflav_PD5038, partial [Pedosphaera parvula Ellin514]